LGVGLRKFIPAIKNAALIALAIFVAYAFIWQRIALHNLIAQINSMEKDIHQLEKNRDYLKGEILHKSSLDQVGDFAVNMLNMKSSTEEDIIIYSDSLPVTARARLNIDISKGNQAFPDNHISDTSKHDSAVTFENEN